MGFGVFSRVVCFKNAVVVNEAGSTLEQGWTLEGLGEDAVILAGR
jgi:hypothetical protein